MITDSSALVWDDKDPRVRNPKTGEESCRDSCSRAAPEAPDILRGDEIVIDANDTAEPAPSASEHASGDVVEVDTESSATLKNTHTLRELRKMAQDLGLAQTGTISDFFSCQDPDLTNDNRLNVLFANGAAKRRNGACADPQDTMDLLVRLAIVYELDDALSNIVGQRFAPNVRKIFSSLFHR